MEVHGFSVFLCSRLPPQMSLFLPPSQTEIWVSGTFHSEMWPQDRSSTSTEPYNLFAVKSPLLQLISRSFPSILYWKMKDSMYRTHQCQG